MQFMVPLDLVPRSHVRRVGRRQKTREADNPMNNRITNDIDRAVGARIRTLRKAQQITQNALAQAVGITYQQVQKYEDGKNRVGASRLQEFARILGVPVLALFGESESTDDADIMQLLFEPDAIELLRAFTAIENEEFRRAVLSVVRTMGRISAEPRVGEA